VEYLSAVSLKIFTTVDELAATQRRRRRTFENLGTVCGQNFENLADELASRQARLAMYRHALFTLKDACSAHCLLYASSEAEEAASINEQQQ